MLSLLLEYIYAVCGRLLNFIHNHPRRIPKVAEILIPPPTNAKHSPLQMRPLAFFFFLFSHYWIINSRILSKLNALLVRSTSLLQHTISIGSTKMYSTYHWLHRLDSLGRREGSSLAILSSHSRDLTSSGISWGSGKVATLSKGLYLTMPPGDSLLSSHQASTCIKNSLIQSNPSITLSYECCSHYMEF